MAALPAGMANANQFLGPLMPNLNQQAGPGLGTVIPNAQLPTDCEIFGNLPTPQYPPPVPAAIMYSVTIRARILIAGRVPGVSEESHFVTFVGDVAIDVDDWIEDNAFVDPAQAPDVYALDGQLFQKLVDIDSGTAPDIRIGVLREDGDTAVYTLDSWTANYRRIG